MDEIEFDAHVEDDVLRLIFTACHPVLSRDARVALTLKLVAGLSTEQIARAFLVPTPTMAARVTRAKKALGDARVPFEVPVGADLLATPGRGQTCARRRCGWAACSPRSRLTSPRCTGLSR
jgi:predicted RNA polymerase sigma factor